MTREEAINKLVNARYADEFQGDEELTEAHLMAIKALSQEPCDDAISRQDAIDAIYEYEFSNWCDKDEVSTILNDLPSVTQKSGCWIEHQDGRWIYAKCSKCGTVHDTQTNFCPNCGAKMESEE